MRKGSYEYLKTVDKKLNSLNDLDKAHFLWFELLKQMTRIGDCLEQMEKGVNF